MPTYCKGNLWGEIGKVDLILFTGCNTMNSQGELVMGAGSAAEAKALDPDLPRDLAYILGRERKYTPLYGIIAVQRRYVFPNKSHRYYKIGAFQTKRHWRDPSDPTIITHSVGMLCGLLYAQPSAFITSVALPFPGIGYGRLSRDQVLPFLEPLPDLVRIYEPA